MDHIPRNLVLEMRRQQQQRWFVFETLKELDGVIVRCQVNNVLSQRKRSAVSRMAACHPRVSGELDS